MTEKCLSCLTANTQKDKATFSETVMLPESSSWASMQAHKQTRLQVCMEVGTMTSWAVQLVKALPDLPHHESQEPVKALKATVKLPAVHVCCRSCQNQCFRMLNSKAPADSLRAPWLPMTMSTAV